MEKSQLESVLQRPNTERTSAAGGAFRSSHAAQRETPAADEKKLTLKQLL
jgi:hypothetical protein